VHFLIEKRVQGRPVVCGYAGRRDDPGGSLNDRAFVIRDGALSVSGGPHDEVFFQKRESLCGSDLPTSLPPVYD